MNVKQLLILMCAAVLLGGAAWLTGRRQARPAPADFGRPLLENVTLEQVAGVVIASPSQTATIRRGDDGWQVEELYGYAADVNRLRRALLRLADAKIGQRVPIEAGDQATLDLTPARATRLTLLDADDQSLATLMLGATRTGQTAPQAMPGMGPFPDGRYVSPDDGHTVYLIAETLHELSEAAPRNWIRRELLSIPGRELARITISGPDRPPIALQRDASDTWVLTDAAPHEALERSRLFAVEGALNYLQLESLADPDLPEAESGLDNPVVFEAHSTSGIVYRVALGNRHAGGESRLARLSVGFAPPDTDADNGGLDAETRATLQREADTLHARLSPWLFVLPAYQADSMMRSREALLKEQEPETDDEQGDGYDNGADGGHGTDHDPDQGD